MTARREKDEYDTIWTIKEEHDGNQCVSGEVIKCGSIVRLEHMETERNLHSHKFDSPLSGRQEVSSYGDGGLGDKGDNWVLECESG